MNAGLAELNLSEVVPQVNESLNSLVDGTNEGHVLLDFSLIDNPNRSALIRRSSSQSSRGKKPETSCV